MKTRLHLFLAFALFLAGISLAQDDPSGNRIHSWTFEGGGVTDVAGGTPAGTLRGDATVTDVGNDDMGLVVTDSGFVELPAGDIQINTHSELSFEFWFTPAEGGNPNFHMLFYFGDSKVVAAADPGTLGYNGVFFSPARGDNVARAGISCGEEEASYLHENGVSHDSEITEGMHHVVCVINDIYIGWYLDGVLVSDAVDTLTTGSDVSTTQNSIANLSNQFAWFMRGGYAGDAPYQGTLHEFNIYDKVLTQEEVTFQMNRGVETESAALGIGDSFKNREISVYTANGAIHVKNPKNIPISSLEVFNTTGQLVFQTDNLTGTVIQHNLAPSLYIVRLRNHKESFSTRLLVR